MMTIIGGLILISLALLALALQRFYSSIPARELQRLAARDDQLAKALYRAAAHGSALRLFLWLIVGFGLGSGLVLVNQSLPSWAGFLVLTVVLLVAFVWVQTWELTVSTAKLAARLAPAIDFCMHYLHSPLQKIASHLGRDTQPHTRLYEKDDLLALFEHQGKQPDNRILAAELELASRALKFSDKLAADIVTSRANLKLVNADETVGPILLGELHASKQTSFLVYQDRTENIIGSLQLLDAVGARQGGRVLDLVQHNLAYVHEDFPLAKVLEVFLATHKQLVIVINGFQEFIGVINLSDLLVYLLGEMKIAPAENFEDPAVIANFQNATESLPPAEDGQKQSSPAATEVVE